jgi:hypothetical protein
MPLVDFAERGCTPAVTASYCCVAALAYTLAAVSPGVMVAMPLLCFILIISLILCGFMIRAPAVPVYW